MRSSCSRSSGVYSSPKSSASKTWRISISDSRGMGLGQRLTQSMASCSDLHFHSQKPAISSFVSANGPSITARLSPENLTLAPFELGWSPSPASITPAFTNSSLNFPMSASSFWLGMTPASESFVALTITMNRIFSPWRLALIGLRTVVSRSGGAQIDAGPTKIRKKTGRHRLVPQLRQPALKKSPFRFLSGQLQGPQIRCLGLGRSTQPTAQVGPRGVRQMIIGQITDSENLINEFNAGCGSFAHGDGDGPV